jgi:hypothetical protein
VRQRHSQRTNKKRIYVGGDYHSMGKTVEQAERINAHVKGRLNAFKGLKGGTKTQSDPPSAV